MISSNYEPLIISVSQKTGLAGAVTAVTAGAAEKTGFVRFLGDYGTEIASACALFGIVLTVLGLIISIRYQKRRDAREAERNLRDAERHAQMMMQMQVEADKQ